MKPKSLIKIVENSIKFSTFSYSAVPRKYIILSSVNFCRFRVSAQIADSASCRLHPFNVTLQHHNWGVWLASIFQDRDNLSKVDKSPAPNYSEVPLYSYSLDKWWIISGWQAVIVLFILQKALQSLYWTMMMNQLRMTPQVRAHIPVCGTSHKLGVLTLFIVIMGEDLV